MKKLVVSIILIFLLSCENSFIETERYVNPNNKIIEFVSFNDEQKVEIGQQIPNFFLNPGTDSEKSIRDFRGKVLMLQFEAEWCSICKSIAPRIAEASNQLDTNKFAIIKIYDAYYKNEDGNIVYDMEKFLEAANKYPANYYNVLNGTLEGFDLTELYNINAVPQSVIVDKEGIMRELRATASMDIVATLKQYDN